MPPSYASATPSATSGCSSAPIDSHHHPYCEKIRNEKFRNAEKAFKSEKSSG